MLDAITLILPYYTTTIPQFAAVIGVMQGFGYQASIQKGQAYSLKLKVQRSSSARLLHSHREVNNRG